MRALVFAALTAFALGGCSQSIERAVSDHAAAPGEGWTMQVLGTDGDRVFMVSAPDGKSAAARIVGGVSVMIDEAEARQFISKGQQALDATSPAGAEKVDIAAPGFSLKVSGQDEDANGKDGGRVRINIGGIKVDVDGDDTAGGHGAVRIGGVNDEAARKFIDDIDELSPDVKQQMREKLGL